MIPSYRTKQKAQNIKTVKNLSKEITETTSVMINQTSSILEEANKLNQR